MTGDYWRVLVRAADSDNWTALAVGENGSLTVSWAKGGGLLFVDGASAAAARGLVKRYGIQGIDVVETKLSHVEEGEP